MRKDAQGRLYVVTDERSPLATLTGISIPAHDAIEMSYSGGVMSSVTYLQGGKTVATLSMTYDENGNLIRVARA